MTKKIRVAILFGGRSAEHEVSLQSARNVYDAIDKSKYDIILIGIDHEGRWHLNDAGQFLLHAESPDRVALKAGAGNLALIPGETTHTIVNVKDSSEIGSVDVAFPILHGPFGEDGTVQGLLKLADVPFVGSDVLGSAVGMDKDVMKRLLGQAGIPQAKFLTFNYHERDSITYQSIAGRLGTPFFIKPANLGSSVGIGKVHNESEFSEVINNAFEFDNKLIAEEFIDGRELECSVLGNEDPIASFPGEVIARHEFYDYEAKYIDSDGARLEIPARVSEKITTSIQDLAIKSFKLLCCSGMARVDFFLKKNGNLLVNELNTIPGFTRISMYPKMWEASGISYSQLIDRLIQLALEKHQGQKRLKFTVKP